MNRTEQNPEALLDALIAGVRDERLDDGQVEESGRRVWARISAAAAAEEPGAENQAPHTERIESCEDFQALFSDYRAGTLSPPRRMLVEDHLHECVTCRKALHPVTVRMSPARVVEIPKKSWQPMRWAAAAAIFVTVGITGFWVWEEVAPPPPGVPMSVIAANGPVYRVVRGSVEPVSAGAAFERSQRLRTSGGGSAMVRLNDGSMVEVAERSEFSVESGRKDMTVRLDRGQIIVQAAKRKRGHLYVAAGDSHVAVTGTVFSVNRGLKGSRVSVVEGSVDVRYRGREQSLKPGDQVTTDSSMARVPITDEISWSQNFDKHLALLRSLVDMKTKLDQVHIATLRYGSRLLDAVPEGTVVYIALPNLGRAIADIQRIVKEQAAQNPELRQQFEKQMPEFERITSHLTQIGEYLGEEIVFASQPGNGFSGVVIAEVHRPGLPEYLARQMGDQLKGIRVEFAGNRVIMGERAELIAEAAKGGSRFAQTPFGQTVSDTYRRGAGLLLAVDLAKTMAAEARNPRGNTPSLFASMGIDSARYLIAEQREINGKTEYSAEVRFSGARRGIASWLAAPGAVGSLNFVSPDAQFAASFVVKDPAQMLKDALSFTQSVSRSDNTVLEFEQAVGIRLDDLAGAMGGEATFALDGPMIPTPAWKVVLEVKDPARVQAAIDKMVAAAREKLRAHGEGTVEITKGQWSGTGPDATWYSIRIPGSTMGQFFYTYVDGYMVAAATQDVLLRSVENRRSGVTLARSREFRSLLPAGGRAHFSGMVYQNAGELLRLLAQGAAAATSPEQQKTAEELAQKVEAALVVLYGEEDRIAIASQGSALNLLTQSMAGQLFGQRANGTKRELHTYR
jgi:hypothetical protein